MLKLTDETADLGESYYTFKATNTSIFDSDDSIASHDTISMNRTFYYQKPNNSIG